MAHVKVNRVQQTTQSTGTGALVLDGVVPARMRSFASAMANGSECWVLIEHQSAAEWEISLATYNAGTITRSFATGSESTTGGLVPFSAGTKTVSVIAPAGATPIVDGSGNMAVPGSITVGGTYNGYTPANKAGDTFSGPVSIGGDPLGFTLRAYSSGTGAEVNVATIDSEPNPSGSSYTHLAIRKGISPSYGLMLSGFISQGVESGGALGILNASVFTRMLELTSLGEFRPYTDNTLNFGSASKRIKEVFSAAGTLNTSDGREKRGARALSDAEIRVAIALLSLVVIYQMEEAYAEKGDDARLHSGWVAQQVEAAFQAEGLDAFRYGCIGFDALTKVETYMEIETRPKMNDVEYQERVVRIVEGQPTLVLETRVKKVPAGTMLQVVDEAGNPVMIGSTPVTDANGTQYVPPPTPMMHFVPETEEVEVARERTVAVTDEEGEPYRRMNLRYNELMAFVLAGVAARLDQLTPA